MPTSTTIDRPSCEIENRREKAVGVAGTEAGKEEVGSVPTLPTLCTMPLSKDERRQ